MRLMLASLAVVVGGPAVGSAQSSCDPRGVWELVSARYGGQPGPANWRQIKFITADHWAFVGEANPRAKDMRSVADSLAAFRSMAAGGGTYTLEGDTYTEKIEYFSDPAYLGIMVVFRCRTQGDRLFQTGSFPIFEGGAKVREMTLEEEWRRIETP